MSQEGIFAMLSLLYYYKGNNVTLFIVLRTIVIILLATNSNNITLFRYYVAHYLPVRSNLSYITAFK